MINRDADNFVRPGNFESVGGGRMVVRNWATSGTSTPSAQCLIITEKVSLKFRAKRAYILSVQSSIKVPKMLHFDEFLRKCDILANFQTLCFRYSSSQLLRPETQENN